MIWYTTTAPVHFDQPSDIYYGQPRFTTNFEIRAFSLDLVLNDDTTSKQAGYEHTDDHEDHVRIFTCARSNLSTLHRRTRSDLNMKDVTYLPQKTVNLERLFTHSATTKYRSRYCLAAPTTSQEDDASTVTIRVREQKKKIMRHLLGVDALLRADTSRLLDTTEGSCIASFLDDATALQVRLQACSPLLTMEESQYCSQCSSAQPRLSNTARVRARAA